MPFPLAALIFAGISFISSSLLRPRQKPTIPKAAGLGDFSFPTAEEARPIPYIAGEVKLAPNFTFFGDLTSTLITKFVKTSLFGTGTRVPLGYRYNVGMELGLCFGPGVHLKKLTMDDKELFSGDVIGAPTTLTILKETLFGGEGEDGEGGVNVILDFYEGNSSQTANTYMAGKYPRQSGHRDVCYAVWRGPTGPGGGSIYVSGKYVSGGGYIGKTPQIRPLAFYLSRIPDFLGSSFKLVNSFEANPANVLYELTTNRLYGGGLSASKIDSTSFQACAQTLFNEGIGCSVIWERTDALESVVQQLVDIMDAALYMDLKTGLIKLVLLRNDYNPATLLEINDDICEEIVQFTRGSWLDTKNELRVNYTSRADDYRTKPAFAQDLANQRIRNATDSETRDYPYITDATQAQKTAYRDLRVASLPLPRATLRCNRHAASLTPGAVFKWTTSRIDPSFSNKIMRVLKANYGRLTDGKVEIECIEDVFSLGGTIYVAPPTSQYVDPVGQPQAANPIYNAEQPYFLSGQSFRPWSLARQPNGSHLSYDLYVSTDAGANYFLKLATGLFTPVGTLQANYGQLTPDVDPTGFELNNVAGLEGVFDPDPAEIPNGAGLILFEDTGEIAAFEDVSFNSVTGRYTFTNIWRGLWDTTPRAHGAGSRVWLFSFGHSATDASYADSTALKLKHLTRNANGELALASATAYDLTINGRADKPYPPANFQVDGSYTGTTHTGDVALTWARRNRLTQTQALKQSAGDQTPEASTTFTLVIKNDSNTVIRTEPGLTGTSYNYTVAQETIDNGGSPSPTLTFELKAVRGSEESEAWIRTSTRV